MAEGETALIVGVGPGLGAALGRVFAGEGMQVALAARHGEAVTPDLIRGQSGGL